MDKLKRPDLHRDRAAAPYLKDETVAVEFARDAGELESLEGPNRYAIGDALVTGTGGARWVVERARFDAKYVTAMPGLSHGENGPYRNRPVVVLAKRMNAEFCIARAEGGDVLHGDSGDWLMQYAPGDYGVVKAQRFATVYRPAAGTTSGSRN